MNPTHEELLTELTHLAHKFAEAELAIIACALVPDETGRTIARRAVVGTLTEFVFALKALEIEINTLVREDVSEVTITL